MTIAQIAFLTVLGFAYLMFIVVLGWTSHTTNKYLREKARQAQTKLQPDTTDHEKTPSAKHFDQAA